MGKNRQEGTAALFSSPSLLNGLCLWFGRIIVYCSLLLRGGYAVKINLLSEIMQTNWFLSHWFINVTFSSWTNGTPSNCSPVLVYALCYISSSPKPTGAIVSKAFFPSFRLENPMWSSRLPGRWRPSRVRSPSGSRALGETLLLELVPWRGVLSLTYIRAEKIWSHFLQPLQTM